VTKKRKFTPRWTRRRIVVLGALFGCALLLGYWVVPEALVAAGDWLIAESQPFEADAIVVLAGGGPDRSREAADMYAAGWAPRVVLGTVQPPDNHAAIEGLGIDLFLPHDNDLRVLAGLGVPASAITRIESPSTETLDEITRVRAFAESQGWSRLVFVTSNYHTRRVLLITEYVFEPAWQVAVIGSRYGEYRPRGWWRNARDARTFLVEFQLLVLYQIYLRPRIWLG
jgi:uncharacterized SAM-binding protein YcdF (DUF218 family)